MLRSGSEWIEGIAVVDVGGEVEGGGNVVVAYGEGHGELSGGIGGAGQDVRNGITAFLSGSPGKEDGIGNMLPGCCFNDSADIKDYNQFLSGCVVDIGKVLHQFPFLAGESPVSVSCLAVVALSGISADGEDGDVCQGFFPLDKRTGYFHLCHYGVSQEDAAAAVVPGLCLCKGNILGVPVLDVRIYRQSITAQSVCNIADICFVDIA